MSDQVEQPSITIYWDLKIEDGLNIKWHPNSEKIESEDDLYSTNISPFVTNLKLWYYDKDFESWDEEENFKEKDKKFLIPDFIELFFKFEEVEYSSFVLVPEQVE